MSVYFERQGNLIHVGEPVVGQLLGQMAGDLRAVAAMSSHPAHTRLNGPINASEDTDDPLMLLERQMGFEGQLELVEASVTKSDLTEAEAEAWIAVLGHTRNAAMAVYQIVTDEDFEALPEEVSGQIHSIGALQVLLIDALDGTDSTSYPDDLPEGLYG